MKSRKTINPEVKKNLAQKTREILTEQIQNIEMQLSELREAGVGKSSAGDKYETQREMIRQSRDLLDRQWVKAKEMLKQLNAIPDQVMHSIQEGALMGLSIGNMWVSVPMGKLVCEGVEYYLISTESPLFMAIRGLKEGDTVSFRGKKVTVLQVV